MASESRFPLVDGVPVFVVAPAGYVVDMAHPLSQLVLGHYLIFGIVGSLAFLALCQRIYTKIFLATGFKLDDALMCAAWVFSMVMQSTQVWSATIGGLGHHAWEMPLDVFEKNMIVTYIAGTAFILCNGCTKCSILVFYLSISPATWYRRAIWASLAIVACYTIVIASMLLWGCDPIRSFWVPELLGTRRCIDANVLYMVIAVANIVSDSILFMIPIPTVLRLKMACGQKIGVMIIFSVASLTLITSVIRLKLLPVLLTSKDLPWDSAPASIWSFLEANLFIICGSMPTLRKFAKGFWPRWMGGSSLEASGAAAGYRYPSGYPLEHCSKSKSRVGRPRNPYEQFDLETRATADNGIAIKFELSTFSTGLGSIPGPPRSDDWKSGGAVETVAYSARREDYPAPASSNGTATVRTKAAEVRHDHKRL